SGGVAVMGRMTKGSPRLPFVAWAFLVLGAALAGGCAENDALQQEVAQLRQDLSTLTLTVHRSRGDAEGAVGQVDRRTRAESADTARQLTALSARLDTVAAELGRVAARLEDVSARVDAVGRQLSARPAPAPPPQGAPPAITPAPSRGSVEG